MWPKMFKLDDKIVIYYFYFILFFCELLPNVVLHEVNFDCEVKVLIKECHVCVTCCNYLWYCDFKISLMLTLHCYQILHQ